MFAGSLLLEAARHIALRLECNISGLFFLNPGAVYIPCGKTENSFYHRKQISPKIACAKQAKKRIYCCFWDVQISCIFLALNYLQPNLLNAAEI
jgi:hypothetical protein